MTFFYKYSVWGLCDFRTCRLLSQINLGSFLALYLLINIFSVPFFFVDIVSFHFTNTVQSFNSFFTSDQGFGFFPPLTVLRFGENQGISGQLSPRALLLEKPRLAPGSGLLLLAVTRQPPESPSSNTHRASGTHQSGVPQPPVPLWGNPASRHPLMTCHLPPQMYNVITIKMNTFKSLQSFSPAMKSGFRALTGVCGVPMSSIQREGTVVSQLALGRGR